MNPGAVQRHRVFSNSVCKESSSIEDGYHLNQISVSRMNIGAAFRYELSCADHERPKRDLPCIRKFDCRFSENYILSYCSAGHKDLSA